MDLLTQGIFGAAVGTAVAGRQLGWKAPVAGLIGGLIPDSDVLWSQGPGVEHWALHRHVTHSLWFGPAVGSMLTVLTVWLSSFRGHTLPAELRWTWWRLWVLVLFTHPLLDTFTQYGTQLFAPFTDLRFALPAVPIIDLTYTLSLLGFLIAALLVGLRASGVSERSTPRGVGIMRLGLLITSCYLLIGAAQNPIARYWIQAYLQDQGIEAKQVHVFTTMFTPWLRRVVVELPLNPDGSQDWKLGFISTLGPKPPEFTLIRESAQLVAARETAFKTPDGQRFSRFAVGPVWADWASIDGHPTVRLSDGRFGLPGPSVGGLWGLEWPLDMDGQPSGTPTRFQVPVEPDAVALRQFFLAKIGRADAGFGY